MLCASPTAAIAEEVLIDIESSSKQHQQANAGYGAYWVLGANLGSNCIVLSANMTMIVTSNHL